MGSSLHRRLILVWTGVVALALGGCGITGESGYSEANSTFDSMNFLFVAFTVGWVFCLGATIGSFLNVVVYRMPAGLSLNHPPSRCPKCETPIRLRDNIPVLGWLILRGRCRACREPISPRYPLVEASTGLIFLLLATVEVFAGGWNLPFQARYSDQTLVWLMWETPWDLIGTCLFHAWAMTLLFGAALMAVDGHETPAGLWRWGIGVGLIVSLFGEHLHPIGFLNPRPEWVYGISLTLAEFVLGQTPVRLTIELAGVIDAVIGLTVGMVIGFTARAVVGGRDRFGLPFAAAIVGLTFGWQFIMATILLAGLIEVALKTATRMIPVLVSIPAIAAFATAALVQLVLWDWSTMQFWWPDYRGWAMLTTWGVPELLSLIASAGLGLLLFAAAARVKIRNIPSETASVA
ncbi:Leader peptidase PppA [Stratiformator vulcanicus]|uniref:Leader peptidase PppA n=1 Tax=Stratiformator vulcanicus TaxID=2527980 RepID=A0A517R528_9PLAN|nr:prepilin peptidase [Stratiformator vulcanicus]QDT38923.1 Leader peptidase PppA [Stratiformator vulcanicus]